MPPRELEFRSPFGHWFCSPFGLVTLRPASLVNLVGLVLQSLGLGLLVCRHVLAVFFVVLHLLPSFVQFRFFVR